MKKKKRGGARRGAGRKPIKDKKIAITIWLKKSFIKEHNGEDRLKQHIYDVLSPNVQYGSGYCPNCLKDKLNCIC